jgi:hypothetical protein
MEEQMYIHVFLTSALVEGEWSASRSYRFNPEKRAAGTDWIGGWMDTRTGLDDMTNGIFNWHPCYVQYKDTRLIHKSILFLIFTWHWTLGSHSKRSYIFQCSEKIFLRKILGLMTVDVKGNAENYTARGYVILIMCQISLEHATEHYYNEDFCPCKVTSKAIPVTGLGGL